MTQKSVFFRLSAPLIYSLLLLACQKPNNSHYQIVTIFANGGEYTNYVNSYRAGIEFAAQNDPNKHFNVVNVAPTNREIDYSNIRAVIGTFDESIMNNILEENADIPLISSRNHVFNEQYQADNNYFPLTNSIESEATILASFVETEPSIYFSDGSFYENYVSLLTSALEDREYSYSTHRFDPELRTYKMVAEQIAESGINNIILVLNNFDYSNVLYELCATNFAGTLIVPNFSVKFGSAPSFYGQSSFTVKYCSYEYDTISESTLIAQFRLLNGLDKTIDNYPFFKDGYIAYSLIADGYETLGNNKITRETLIEVLHQKYANLFLSPHLADVLS